ncbi:glutamate racemase [Halobacteriovorax marinus]|uniref:glutamate racemase n=1 Tax=Halobacteriovorax marinus TaxID=97084 RepID=UPI000BC359BE|nr:glutamate racemase [Halobacteriovorax marinus]ATH07845.1 glutamate racemase [Halobacteriovorax marinus]
MGQRKALSIGIFDSGIGGFSILKKIHELAPELEVYYIADQGFAPYGNKSRKEVIDRCHYLCHELMKFDLDLIVVACNTATGVAIDELRNTFTIPFVGVEPFVNALSKHTWKESDRACVITTELMSKSERFQKLVNRLDPDKRLFYKVTPGLATIVEDFFINKNEEELNLKLKEELSFVGESSYSHLILGCTHYPLIAKYIEATTGASVLSPCLYVANRVLSLLDLSSGESSETFQFASTAKEDVLRFVSKDFSNLP